MRIDHLRLNHLTNPVGYRLDGLRFSWVVSEAEGQKQQAARITVSQDENFTTLVFDSGRDETANSVAYAAEFALAPVTRYYWRVEVWTDAGEYAESTAAYFETAKDTEPWRFSWITPDLPTEVQPLLRKDFSISGEIRQARAYVTGLGLFELEINGEKAGHEYLLPGFHSYDQWVQYCTFDITRLLREGGNTAGARLGDGWYKSRLMFPGTYGDRIALLCEIRIDYADGRVEYVGTDDTWLSHASETVFSGIYDGERVDARLACEGWSHPDCVPGEDWRGVLAYEPAYIGPLSARLSPPIAIIEERKPTVIITPSNETVLDFGQIMTGWVSFETAAPEGTEILLQYGEILQDECFFNTNLRSAKAEFHYIADGKARSVRPHFTFYGFRYVKVSGWPGPIDPACFTGCVLMSAMERTGRIKTANPLINQLVENIVWGQKGNFLDVPTDCPQRDERLGWTGDAQVFCGTGCFNMYAPAFYHKYLTDMRHEQHLYGGSIPYVVPQPKRRESSAPLAPGQLEHGHGSAAWADAATVVPWVLYLHYGDKSLLAHHYPLMKDFVDYMIRRDQADGDRKLCQIGFHFADWLALDNLLESNSAMGDTDPYYIASAYYAYSTGLLAKAATVLGKDADAAYYGRRANEIKEAIQREYFTETGRCALQTQTAAVIALFMDLIPPAFVPRTAEALQKRLQRRKMHLETGFVGTPYLCRVLSSMGMNEAAYTLMFNEDYPSWLYEVKMGATTVWERWNSVLPNGKLSDISMNSLNHYAYGSVGEWLYRDVCGLNPSEEAPGFKKVTIAPKPDPRLPWAELTMMTASGEYAVAWRYEDDDRWILTLTVPFDCEAQVQIPEGLRVNSVQDAHSAAVSVSGGSFMLGAGRYTISCGKSSDKA